MVGFRMTGKAMVSVAMQVPAFFSRQGLKKPLWGNLPCTGQLKPFALNMGFSDIMGVKTAA